MAKKTKTHQLRHIVAVSNNKGGAGKTSTVLNLASAIARRIEGYRVLVIDCDPQRNLSYFLGWDDRRELEGSPTLYSALCNESQGLPVYRADNGLYFTPASVNLNGIDAILSLRPNPSKALSEILQRTIDNRTGEDPVLGDSIAESFDFIFIDTQPAMSRMTYNALYAADGYIIPTELEEASVKGMTNIAVAASKVGADTNRLTIHGILITKLDGKLRSAKLYEPQIRKTFRETFDTAVRRSKDIIESQALREDVFTSYAGGRAAEDYTALASEYLKKFGK
ncbi:MAG: ParA family protein [Prevotellaceae bacterium]|nr:ParA family protein [Prevotellaceae bacterium]